MSWTLAVDFGTTNTAAAYRADGGPAHPVRLSDQAEQMPSAVLALDTGILVGGAAVRSARLDPQRFEPSPKRRLGEGEILLGPREWPVSDLVAEVLTHVKQKAMWVAGGMPPDRLVLTYPQQWAQGRKELLVRAAGRAGFDPGSVRLVSEPIAAASWYASTQPVPPGKCVAVFDFGGGTCDVAILRARPEEPGTFVVLAAEGADPLGGETLDQLLLDWTLGQLTAGGNRALVDTLGESVNLGAMLTLREQVRHAKHELAEYSSARIPVAVGQLQTIVTITTAEFDAIIGPEIDAAIALTRRALVQSGVAPAELHALYLTGGSSHLRLVHRKITELLGRPPATLNDPKLVVAQGALLVPPAVLEGAPAPRAQVHPTGEMPRPAQAPGPPAGQPMVSPTGPVPGFRPPDPSAPRTPSAGPAPAPGAPPAGERRIQVAAAPPPGQPPGGSSRNAPPPSHGQQRGQPPQPNQGPRPLGSDGRQSAPPPVGGPPRTQAEVGSSPSPGKPNGSPGGRKLPKWVIPVAAAVVVAIVAVVLILTLGGGSEEAGTTTVTSGSVAETTDAPSTGCSDDSTDPACQQPDQICQDGSTISATETCSQTPATSCWDGSPAAPEQKCPQLIGQDALEWVFPAPREWVRVCTPSSDKFDNEVEVYSCKVDQLPGTIVYLSRWTNSQAAKDKYTDAYGESSPWELTDEDTPVGVEWQTTDTKSGTEEKLGVQVRIFDDSPFSMLVVVTDPDGAGKSSLETWYSDQLFRAPDAIASQGSLP